MLTQFIALWKAHSFLKRIVEEFSGMLEDDEFVFATAWDVLTGRATPEAAGGPLRERDVAVNKRERRLRRIVLEHLSFNPGQDVSGCLAMMSVVKDAERIGDYAKNIYDLAAMLEGKTAEMKYLGQLSETQQKIAANFPTLRRAFTESDEETAHAILKAYGPIKEECSSVLRDLLPGKLSAQEAVATALISRYLKRINSHMSNIASGIVYPLDRIDFVRGDILE